MEEKDLHRKFAVACFNSTWDYLDKANRTSEEDARMIHMAHASRYHWGEIGTPVEFERGDWQISRVYAVLGEAENALKFAQSCLHTCLENQIGDFDLAFAYEAVARAHSVAGNAEMRDKHLALAKQAGEAIARKEDQDYFFSELTTIGN